MLSRSSSRIWRPETSRTHLSNAANLSQGPAPALFGRLRRGEQGIPLSLDSLDLLKQKLKAIEFAANLSFEMHRQRTAIARLQFVKSLAPVAAKRLVIGYALVEQQSFDPVNVAGSARRSAPCAHGKAGDRLRALAR